MQKFNVGTRVVASMAVAFGCGACSADQGQEQGEARHEAGTEESLGMLAESLSPLPDVFPDTSAGCPSAALVNPVTLYVSPSGSDLSSNPGTSSASPLATLQGAQNRISTPVDRDYRIIVKGGTYLLSSTKWTKSSTTKRIHIEAAANETPILDGRNSASATLSTQSYALYLAPNSSTAASNITVRGLTIMNYGQSGIYMHGRCNRIYDNKLINIGNDYSDCRAIRNAQAQPGQSCSQTNITNQPWCSWVQNRGQCTQLPWDPNDSAACRCIGYGSILLTHSSDNIVQGNDVLNAMNSTRWADSVTDTLNRMHSLYVAEGSQGNLLKDNYIRRVSGAPVKFSNDSGDNAVVNNYLERAGDGNFFHDDPSVSGGTCQPPSLHNILVGNVATFSTTGANNVLTQGPVQPCPASPNSFDLWFGQDGSHYFQGTTGSTTSENEYVAASVMANIDGSGRPEPFIALNYPNLNYTKIVYKDGNRSNGTSNQFRTAADFAHGWQVRALAGGDFDGTGKQQVVAAYFHTSSGQSQIWVGSLADGIYRFTTKLADATDWDVSAMTAGKFGSDTTDKLITAVTIGGIQKVFRGDGKTAMSGSSMPGVNNGSPIYSNDNWRITAMTNGPITGGANQLITAFHWLGTSQAKHIYIGNGTSTAAGQSIYQDATKPITALAFGKFGGVLRLITGFDVAGKGTIYASDGTTSNLLSIKLYENTYWDVTSLAAGQLDSDSNDEIMASFDNAGQTQVYYGNGIVAGSGATNAGQYYRAPN